MSEYAELARWTDRTFLQLHKRNYNLEDGDCINDEEMAILTFEAREVDGNVQLKTTKMKTWVERTSLGY